MHWIRSSAGKIAAFNFLSAVVLGAIGGHNYTWIPKRKERFQTAQLYHVVNGVGLFMCSFVGSAWGRTLLLGSFGAGLAFFVLPLYWMALKEDDNFPLRKAMPLGGVSTMLGFAGLVLLL